MQSVKFYPNDSHYKSRLGAVKVNDVTDFRIEFNRPSNPSKVYMVVTKDGEMPVRYLMNYEKVDENGFVTFAFALKVTSRGLYFYHFEIETDSDELFRIGSQEDLHARTNCGQEWQLTVFEQPYFPPDWLSGGVMYQILVDRFFIGGERLKTKRGVVYRDDWGGTPYYKPDENGKYLNNDFFGGNLKGITKKLAYLKSLGVTCLYLNPIFEAHSNHKYDTGNYRRVDMDFGTADELKELIKKADKKGIKILLDGVFSHTGDDSIYFNKYGTYDSVGAYQSKESPYYDWYRFTEFPDSYECWWDVQIHPNTVEENIHYDEFINGEEGIISHWTSMGLGGWRLDVADELPDKFLDNATRAAKRVNPNALMLGEVWEDASNKIAYSKRRRYLQGGQLDSVTNYPFKEDIISFINSGDAKRLNNTINIIINNYPKNVLDNLMNILGTHDTERILTNFGEYGITFSRDDRANARLDEKNLQKAIEKLKMATVLQFTLVGVPCIYYGDEAGLEGFEDPFNRRCFPWDNKNKLLQRWYKRLGAIRNDYKDVYAHGSYRMLKAENGIYAFARKNHGKEIITISNNSDNTYKTIFSEGYTDLITLRPFKGNVSSKNSVIITKTENVIFPPKKVQKKKSST